MSVQGGTGHTKHDSGGGSGLATFGEGRVVAGIKGKAVDDFTADEGSVARVFDLDFAGHLADYHFKVFVGDGDALGLINSLDLLDQVSLGVADTPYSQNLLDILRTRSQRETSGNQIFVFDGQGEGGWDKVFFFDIRVAGGGNDDFVTTIGFDNLNFTGDTSKW